MFGNVIIAVASLAALTAAAPAADISRRQAGEIVTGVLAAVGSTPQAGGAAVDKYTYYAGDGSASAGWPAVSSWASYDALFAANTPLMGESCANNAWGENNSAEETAAIDTAIKQAASATMVDPRFILAIIMQESKGCVRVPTTNNGIRNPGLLQSHDGTGTCAGTSPCPASQIVQMVSDGTAGTASGLGIAALLNQAHTATGGESAVAGCERSFYAAARLYNSGSADYTNLDNGLSSTACYASDVANRLMGWALAPTGCKA